MFWFQSKRSIKYIASTAPGPGLYGLPSMLTTRKDFNRGSQSVFCQPIAEHVEKTNGIPAPNMYNVCYSEVHHVKNIKIWQMKQKHLHTLNVCVLFITEEQRNRIKIFALMLFLSVGFSVWSVICYSFSESSW